MIKPAVLYCEVDQHRTVALSPSEKSQYFQLSQNQMATLALQNKTLHSVERSALMKFIGLYVNGGISTDSMDMQSGVQEEKLFAELNDQAGEYGIVCVPAIAKGNDEWIYECDLIACEPRHQMIAAYLHEI